MSSLHKSSLSVVLNAAAILFMLSEMSHLTLNWSPTEIVFIGIFMLLVGLSHFITALYLSFVSSPRLQKSAGFVFLLNLLFLFFCADTDYSVIKNILMGNSVTKDVLSTLFIYTPVAIHNLFYVAWRLRELEEHEKDKEYWGE